MIKRTIIWVMLLLIIVLQQGCFESLVQATTSPQSLVADSASQLGQGIANAAANAGSAEQDIDRILRENPDAANRNELLAMRDSLHNQGQPAGKRYQEPRRQGPIYTGISLRRSDRLLLWRERKPKHKGLIFPDSTSVTADIIPGCFESMTFSSYDPVWMGMGNSPW